MLSMHSQFAIFLAVGGLLWLQTGSWARDHKVQEQAKSAASAETSAALADVPAGQVVVSYENGELTIKANNAPLVDVLRAVCGRIGAELDAPPEAREPIHMILGPAPARLVLAALLDGSQLNYAMRKTADDPNALASVIVFPKAKDSKTFGPIAQDRVSQNQVSSTTAPAPPGSATDTKQLMRELLTQAKAEMANSGGIVLGTQGVDENAGDADVASTAPQIEAANVLKLVEAQITAIGDAAATDINSSQTGQPASDAALQNLVGRPRHRRRH